MKRRKEGLVMKKRNFKNDWALFSYITAYIKPYLGILLLATIALAGNLVLLLLRPYITKQVIDLGFAANDINVIEYYAVIYGLTIIGSVLCIFVENYFLKSFGQKIIYNIRAIVFQKILHKSHDEFYKLPIGNWVTRITNDVESLRTLYTDVLLNLASSGLMIIGILGFMYAINVPLAIIMTILLPIMGVIIWVFQKFSRKAFRQVRRSVAASNASIKELLNYIVIVKSYSGEKEIEERYNTVNKGFLEAGLFEVTTFSIFRPLVDGLFFVALIVIFTTTNLIDSIADAGTVFAFIQYMDRFFQPLKDIADKYNSLQSSLAGAERLVPLLEEKERNMVDEVPKELIPVESIEFDHVWFSYENNDVYALQDFTLHIKAGDFTGIVGPSGSGKSTLLSLLMGIYKPTKGSIYINGIDISKYDSSVLRHLMGYVFQQAYLFKGSIKDNLTLFDNSISHDEMIKAAKQVNLDSMIEQLPEGYNTPVGYLGSLLSDGQKQLLAFGRTLIRNIPILLLDEATANIDSHTEKQIQASIENIRGSKTIVSIAHRLSTVQDANEIVYIEYGKIKEKGSFNELIELKGAFYNLWIRQKSGS
jgi:ATP-binding cassette subfamily B protein